MTAILTWNIQNGKGCDGATELARIARVAKAMGEADVLCFQEVSRRDAAIAGGADQVAQLEALFRGYVSGRWAGIAATISLSPPDLASDASDHQPLRLVLRD